MTLTGMLVLSISSCIFATLFENEYINFQLSSKEIYHILLLNNKTVISSKSYWPQNFQNTTYCVVKMFLLTEIRDFYSKDGLSGKDRLFITLFMRVRLGCQYTQALGIFYAQVIEMHFCEHRRTWATL